MGDHFVLLVDRLLTESTLEAAIQSRKQLQQMPTSANDDMTIGFTSHRMDIDVVESSSRKLEQCRICHDEDEEFNMEVPCSCCGSLKYAHRRCVQRWCNEKGDTICEICLQQFKPGYTAPPPLFQYGSIPMNFRGNWEISSRDLHNHQLISMVSADHNFHHPHYNEYSIPSSGSLTRCRTFMILLVLRHSLPVLIYGAEQYSFTSFAVLILKTVGILLPMYIIVKALAAIRRWHHLQNSDDSQLTTSYEEYELPQRPPQPHMIFVP